MIAAAEHPAYAISMLVYLPAAMIHIHKMLCYLHELAEQLQSNTSSSPS